MFVKRLDRRGRVVLHAAQEPGVREAFGLSEAETARAAWAFSKGRRFEGAGAVNLVLDAALGLRIFVWFYRLPLIRRVQDRVYAWVAANRQRFRGVVPWCERFPGRCAE